MTDTELDLFYFDTLSVILQDLQDCAVYTKNLATPEYIEINQDYSYSIRKIQKVLKNCTTIDKLAEEDEDTIDFVYNCLSTYADNFIISAYEPAHSIDLQEYSKIEELLDLFLGDDDFDEESL